MKIGLLPSPPFSEHRTLKLIPEHEGDLDALAMGFALPWKLTDGGDYIVHASSVLALLKEPYVSGFASPRAKAIMSVYWREAARTFGPDRMTRTSDYDWSRHFTAELQARGYQFAGMDRIYFRAHTMGSGVILADDVGLGKTPQAIGVLQRLRAEGHIGVGPGNCVVVVTGTSLKTQWKDEIERFAAPMPRTIVIDGSGIERRRRLATPAAVYIINYEMARLPQYRDRVRALRPKALVLDETSAIKNAESATAREILELARGARYRLPFNATPIENGLADMWGQVKSCDRLLLGSWPDFDARYIVRDERNKVLRYQRVGEFKRRAALAWFRRTAADCGEQMPAVVAQIRPCVMGTRQWDAYKLAAGEYVRGHSTGGVAMAKLAAVRYAAFAADVEDPASESAKLDDLVSLLDGELSGERVVVFSQYTTVVNFAAKRLARFRPLMISGEVSSAKRTEARRVFASTSGEGRVMLGTAAMQRGLNLQAAGVVFNLDLPWNPARLRQCVGRVARIGQTRARVLCLNATALAPDGAPTVDGYFIKTVLEKRGIFDLVFGDDGTDELGADTANPEAVREYLRAGPGAG